MKRWLFTFTAMLAAGLVLFAVQWQHDQRERKRTETEKLALLEWERTAQRFTDDTAECLGTDPRPETIGRVEALKVAGSKLIESPPGGGDPEPITKRLQQLDGFASRLRAIDWRAVNAWEQEARKVGAELGAAMKDQKITYVYKTAERNVALQRAQELHASMPWGADASPLRETLAQIESASNELGR